MGVVETPFQLAIIGAGYVGLVTAASFAKLGCEVRCIDRRAERIADLQRGVMPFLEPGLAEAVAESTAVRRLTFSTSTAATHGASAAFVCVGTLDASGEWSPRDVETALAELAADKDAPRTLIVRSTLMPGTTARLQQLVAAMDPDIELAANPEFTRQGVAMTDFMSPDRLIFGLTRPVADSRALPLLERAYAAIDTPKLVTDAATSELIKVGSNVFLALKAGFANEMARLSAATGADAATVVHGTGLDRRIGRQYLNPGPGFGGSCLPSQSRALPQTAEDLGVEMPILRSVTHSNALQAQWVVDQLERAVGALSGKRVCVLGLAFKQGTSDVRESPAVSVCRALSATGAVVTAHDPMAIAEDYDIAESPLTAAREADALVVATDWPEYRELNWSVIAAAMCGKTVFDTRSIVDARSVRDAGLTLLTL